LDKLNEDVKIVAPFYINEYLLNMPKNIVFGTHVNPINYRFNRVLFKINNYLSRRIVKKYQPNIIHETYYSKFPIITSKCPRVLTVYDLIHERFNNFFSSDDDTIELKKQSILRADHIISISDNTKKDLMEIYNIDEKKISTIYLAPTSPSSKNVFKKESLYDKPYLLYVGGREGYKNFDLLIKAIGLSHKLKKSINLIAFGGPPFNVEEKKLIENAQLTSNQIVYMNGNDNILYNLYQNAEAFVFPSLYEGFGIPPLEAMRNGCPVISSNTSSIPEVVGNAGEYFNPESVEEIIYAMEKVIFSNVRKKELIALGFQRSKMFTWKKCANETLSIYKTLL